MPRKNCIFKSRFLINPKISDPSLPVVQNNNPLVVINVLLIAERDIYKYFTSAAGVSDNNPEINRLLPT